MHKFASGWRKHAHIKLFSKRDLSHFRTVEHVVPCSHTRSYPGATEPGCENDLKLAVKQYIPLRTHAINSQSTPITIVGGHANGFPKELYEPLWDDLYEQLEPQGQSIRSIWIADIAQQGESGVLNESILGDDPNWWDQARDLLFLINQKQRDMPQPLIGIGHSMGASMLAAASLLHPQLFQSLVLIDPVIQTENPSMSFAPASTYRRDLWLSRQEAAASFAKSKFYQSWDSRVLDRWVQYGLRDTPTELYPEDATPELTSNGTGFDQSREPTLRDKSTEEKPRTSSASNPPVTLTTTTTQEITHYLRPLYKLGGISPPPSSALQHRIYPDINPFDLVPNYQFYRPEPASIFRRLPSLLPSVQYIFGATSLLATPDLRLQKMQQTGAGVEGSGGVSSGRVQEVLLDTGHMVPFEKPTECAESAASWITSEVKQWKQTQEEWKQVWQTKSRRERIGVDGTWKKYIPRPERVRKQQ